MDFLEDAKPVSSSDFFYDLFEGGYIEPYNFLEKHSAKEVNAAIETIRAFQSGLEDRELLEDM